MLARCGHRACGNPAGFKYYIEKGIEVCPEWQEFIPFANWALAHGYAEGLTIDRIDSDKGYSPENCRWVSMTENLRNRKDRILNMEKAREIRRRRTQGEPVKLLAAEYGVKPFTIWKVQAGLLWAE